MQGKSKKNSDDLIFVCDVIANFYFAIFETEMIIFGW